MTDNLNKIINETITKVHGNWSWNASLKENGDACVIHELVIRKEKAECHSVCGIKIISSWHLWGEWRSQWTFTFKMPRLLVIVLVSTYWVYFIHSSGMWNILKRDGLFNLSDCFGKDMFLLSVLTVLCVRLTQVLCKKTHRHGTSMHGSHKWLSYAWIEPAMSRTVCFAWWP